MSGFGTIAGTDSLISTWVIRIAQNDSSSSSRSGDQRVCSPKRQREWLRNLCHLGDVAGATVLITWAWYEPPALGLQNEAKMRAWLAAAMRAARQDLFECQRLAWDEPRRSRRSGFVSQLDQK